MRVILMGFKNIVTIIIAFGGIIDAINHLMPKIKEFSDNVEKFNDHHYKQYSDANDTRKRIASIASAIEK